jgi:dephospho-CoA kinase
VTVRIGLTGPIGCGKSTVAGWLAALGAAVVDADVVAREVTAAGTPGADAVLAEFGDGVRAADGSLDRGALAEIVFADPERLRALERIVHPLVRPRVLEAIGRADRELAPAVVIEAIKLVEGGLADLCDEVWLVTCAADEQLVRLRGRGASEQDARRRIEAQANLVERLTRRATRVLDTSGAADGVRATVERAYREALDR